MGLIYLLFFEMYLVKNTGHLILTIVLLLADLIFFICTFLQLTSNRSQRH